MERTLKSVHGSLQVTVPKQLAELLGWQKGKLVSFQQRPGGLFLSASDKMARIVVTIGYERHSPESFVAALQKANVQVLVDVRNLPLSRRKGFSKTALSSKLQSNGIEYRHSRTLGAPPEIRSPYKNGGSLDSFRSAYRSHLSQQGDAVDSIKWLASRRNVAIMCVEREVESCHRQLISDELAREGFEIHHA